MSYRHGTRYGYRDKGCRCAECRRWNSAEKRRLYELRKSREGDAAQTC